MSEEKEEIFKQCTLCGMIWYTREEFLSDKNIMLVGYMANFRKLDLGFLLFNHNTCKTTLSIQAKYFNDMYDGEIYHERKTGSHECLGLCLRRDILDKCPAKCECAYIREILDTIKKMDEEKIS